MSTNGRWAQWMLATAMSGAMLYFVWRFGPVPQPRHAAGTQETSPTAPGASVDAPFPVDFALGEMGASRSLVASGCEAGGMNEFLTRRNRPDAWNAHLDDMEVIGEGNGAESRLTVASEAGCGVDWKTYRYSFAGKPGAIRTEPDSGVPAPPRARILFEMPGAHGSRVRGYSSELGTAALNEWYRRQMAGWRGELLPNGPGTMVYARGRQYCVIWIGTTPKTAATTVLVSSGTM